MRGRGQGLDARAAHRLEELAGAGRQIYVFYNNPLAVGLLIAAIYVVINTTLSRLAVALEARQRRRVSAS